MLKRILVIIAIACLLAASVACCFDQGEEKIFHVESEPLKPYKAIGNAGSFSFEIKENMELVAENDYLVLCYDKETLNVTVCDKRSGKEYTTNPTDESIYQTNSKLAQLNLIYSNSQGKSGNINSYSQSVDLDQVEVVKENNKITFNYSIGDFADGLETTPSVLSNERFNYFCDKADAEQEKILKRRYGYYKETDNWTRRSIASKEAIKEHCDVFKALGYTQ